MIVYALSRLTFLNTMQAQLKGFDEIGNMMKILKKYES